MDFLDLKVFVAAAEMGSMSKAAQEVALSQPSVSSRMAKLEAELDASLFRRGRSGTYLTESGRRFYFYALYALSALEAGRQAVVDTAVPRIENSLNIGMAGSLIRILTPPVFAAVNNGGLTPECHIRTGESTELAVLTASGVLDAAYISQISFSLPLLEVIPLFEEPVVLVGPADTAQPRYRSLASFLRSEPFILLKRGMPLRELIEKELFSPLRMHPNRLIEVDSTDMIRVMVAQGAGYSLLPYSSLWITGSEMSVSPIPLDEIRLKQSFQCVYSPALSEKRRRWFSDIHAGINQRVEHLRSEYFSQ
jgi:DNA-binding transcriptional LysR family regulator